MILILQVFLLSILSNDVALNGNNQSQVDKEKLLLKQALISEAIRFEKSINPDVQFRTQEVIINSSYYPLAEKFKVNNPLVVNRKSFYYLPLTAEYYFTKEDSVIRLIIYDWEKGKYEDLQTKIEIFKQEKEKLKVYTSEYKRIKSTLIESLGNPTEQDQDLVKNKGSREDYYTQKTIWDNTDLYVELKMIHESTTYRIRAKIYWKK